MLDRTGGPSASSEALYPVTGSDLESLHMVLEHTLFSPVPDSNKMTTAETFGSAVCVVPN